MSRAKPKVHLEPTPGFLHGHVLQCAVQPVAGVVDQHINASGVGNDHLNQRHHGLVVGDIDRSGADTAIGQIRHPIDSPGTGIDGVAELRKLARSLRRCQTTLP